MKSCRWFLILCLGFIVLSCSVGGGTYSLYLRYDPVRDFPALQQKLGSTVGLAPFKDERSEPLYVGTYVPNQGVSSYFQSEPAPLEKAISDSISQVLSRQGVKTVPVSDWNGQPDALRNMETDSILSLKIRRFRTEAKGSLFKTEVVSKVSFIVFLGVKKEGKVFTRTIEFEKEMSFPNWKWGRDRMEEIISQNLRDVFDEFFSNPY
jgi:hypothetical protein